MNPIRRPSELWPAVLLNEYRRLASLGVPPVTLRMDEEDSSTHFRAQKNVDSIYFRYCQGGADYAGLLASVAWLSEGPKIVDVTEEQFQALSQVEVRLEVKDFRMPYNTMLINMPPGRMHKCVLMHLDEVHDGNGTLPVLIGGSISYTNLHDIVTVARQEPGKELETSLGRFYGTVEDEEGRSAHLALRVACNMALAMTNFGCQASYVFPAEVERERKYIAKGDRAGRDGRTSSQRLAEQPMLVTLDREVKLWHREGGHESGDPTGRIMPFHWRRGHWRKARVGEGRAQTKLVFVRPCMVRADLLRADQADTTTTYV